VHDTTITNSLNKLKLDIFGEENASVILHRREIMDKKGVFSVLKDEALRSRFDEGFKKIVSDLPIPSFTVSIDKLEHLNKYKTWQFNPYHYVMTCLLERFVLWLHRTGNLGDVLGEARNPTHDGQLRRAFRRFYKEGTTVRTHIIRAKLISGELKLDTKKANVAGLQIADLLAHPAHRTFKFEQEDQTIPDDYGASLASILIDAKYDRNPKNGFIKGYGRKWLP
jgi:hypothetical protein